MLSFKLSEANFKKQSRSLGIVTPSSKNHRNTKTRCLMGSSDGFLVYFLLE